MPSFERDDVAIHYIERGDGFPILSFAPGGMRSAAGFWKNAPWNPLTALSDRFRVVAMDQRNAGKSRAPVLAPNAQLVERWKEEDVVGETVARVRSFLEAHTP